VALGDLDVRVPEPLRHGVPVFAEERGLQLVVVRDGQFLLTDAAARFRSAVEYDGSVAGRLRPDQRTPDVIMDPERAFGQPAVRSPH
jgi:hypothetical protein